MKGEMAAFELSLLRQRSLEPAAKRPAGRTAAAPQSNAAISPFMPNSNDSFTDSDRRLQSKSTTPRHQAAHPDSGGASHGPFRANREASMAKHGTDLTGADFRNPPRR